jgi:hypothetical protein
MENALNNLTSLLHRVVKNVFLADDREEVGGLLGVLSHQEGAFWGPTQQLHSLRYA